MLGKGVLGWLAHPQALPGVPDGVIVGEHPREDPAQARPAPPPDPRTVDAPPAPHPGPVDSPPSPDDGRGEAAPVAVDLAELLLAVRTVAAARRVRRAVVRLVGAGATAAIALVVASILDARFPGVHRTILAGAAVAALLPVAVGAWCVGRTPGLGAAYLVGTAVTSGLDLFGIRLFVRDGVVPWVPLLAYGVLVAAPCWALAGWVARASWQPR